MKKESRVYSAAVVGLGNIGFLLGRDCKRKGVWSHVDAYEQNGRTHLAAVVEPDDERRKAFSTARPEIPAYSRIDEMLKQERPDLVSICTPTEYHAHLLQVIMASPGIQAVFCEKPVTRTSSQARDVSKVMRDDVVVAVNHLRRWNSVFIAARELIRKGSIGRIKTIHAHYPGQIYNIGSHLFDALRMLSGLNPETVCAFFADAHQSSSADPSLTGVFRFSSGCIATFSATGRREDLVFEIDIVGNQGRVRLLDNGTVLKWYLFTESENYSGYRELEQRPSPPIGNGDPFLTSLDHIIDTIEGKREHPGCTYMDGYWSLCMIEAAIASARSDGKTIAVVDGRNARFLVEKT
jgi:predicted dehydrogenase